MVHCFLTRTRRCHVHPSRAHLVAEFAASHADEAVARHHVFIWMHAEPDRLSRRAKDLLIDPDTELHLSVVVAWELGIKIARERLTLPEPLDEYVTSHAHRSRMSLLPIGLLHVLDGVHLTR